MGLAGSVIDGYQSFIMATPGQIAKALAASLNVPLGTVNFYAVALRKAGLLSTNGRGRSAARMTTADAATWLMSLCVASSAETAPEATRKAWSLPLQAFGETEGEPIFSLPTWLSAPFWERREFIESEVTYEVDCHTLGTFLESLLSEVIRLRLFPYEEHMLPIGSIDFEPQFSTASVYLGYDPNELLLFTDRDEIQQNRVRWHNRSAALDPRERHSSLDLVRRLHYNIFPYLASVLADDTSWVSKYLEDASPQERAAVVAAAGVPA